MMLIDLYFEFISSFFSLSSIGLKRYIKVKENIIKVQIATNGGKMRFENLDLLLNPNFIFLEIFLDK